MRYSAAFCIAVSGFISGLGSDADAEVPVAVVLGSSGGRRGPGSLGARWWPVAGAPVMGPKGKVVFRSDRGTQYTSKTFDTFCKANRIRRSLGRTGICYDNAVAESFFASYKKELMHVWLRPGLKSVQKATFEWIEMCCNRTRRHSTLGYLTPHEYKLGYRHINQLAT